MTVVESDSQPGDGIVSSLAERFNRELGFCKNCFDAFCVVVRWQLGWRLVIH